MPSPETFSEIINNSQLSSKMQLVYQGVSPVIEFSNTGARGEKSFIISLRSLIQSLRDIAGNIDKFSPFAKYDEATWRNLFHTYLTDSSTNTLSTVQTLPLFTVLSKTIHLVTGAPPQEYIDHYIHLDKKDIQDVIGYLESQIPDETTISTAHPVSSTYAAAGKGVNEIYYGAPGTGKSYRIDKQVVGAQTVRTVFHSETQNSDFIGCLKPSVSGIGEDRKISYTFMPGPFAVAVAMALKNPTQHHWLVIEEINRAAAASVFGEVFQLLDRNANGASQYDVTITDPSFCDYLKATTGLDIVKLRLPANLSILATMNSSDQGVLPMDTAFKRRWKFVYVPINFATNAPAADISFTREDGSTGTVKWSVYAQTVNSLLAARGIQEDRHIGPYFLSNEDLLTPSEALMGKLFIYLWDDVLRHGWRDLVFHPDIKTYGDLVTRASANSLVYSSAMLEALSSAA